MSKELDRRQKKADRETAAARQKLLTETRGEVIDLLNAAKDSIVKVLASAPSDYQQWHLSNLQKEIDRVLAEFGGAAGSSLSAAVAKAFGGGAAAIDAVLSASGIDKMMPVLDSSQLMAIRSFTVDRIKDVSAVAASKIRSEIGLAMIGSQTIQETIGRVSQHLGDGSLSRASTIVRDNLAVAWETASFERAEQSEEYGVPMDKIWRRSGKTHSRLAHDLADGTRVHIDKPFVINGHKIRYPHDPKAPLAEIINCGCVAIYRPRDVKGTLPDKRPFSADELARNPNKAEIQSGKSIADLLGDKATLPNFQKASIGIEKLKNYALDPDHPIGGNKARRIKAALGWGASDAEIVAEAIRAGLATNNAALGNSDEHGQRYAVDMELTGPTGKAIVRTAWIIDNDGSTPRFVSFYVKRS